VESDSFSEVDMAQRYSDYDNAATAADKCDALNALIEADTKHAVTILRDAYADPEPDVRREAVVQMYAFKSQADIIDLLIKALNDPDTAVAIEAVEALAHVHEKRAIAGLKKIAKAHPDETMREVAKDYVEQLEP
jgi:HEAT repeat protein